MKIVEHEGNRYKIVAGKLVLLEAKKSRTQLQKTKDVWGLNIRYFSTVSLWQDFDNFFKDMGLRPGNYMLSKISPNKTYNKDNCFWGKTGDISTCRVLYRIIKRHNLSEGEVDQKLFKNMNIKKEAILNEMGYFLVFYT